MSMPFVYMDLSIGIQSSYHLLRGD